MVAKKVCSTRLPEEDSNGTRERSVFASGGKRTESDEIVSFCRHLEKEGGSERRKRRTGCLKGCHGVLITHGARNSGGKKGTSGERKTLEYFISRLRGKMSSGEKTKKKRKRGRPRPRLFVDV